jgi:hypothetical protein
MTQYLKRSEPDNKRKAAERECLQEPRGALASTNRLIDRPKVSNPQSDSTDEKAYLSTRGQKRKKWVKSVPKSTTKRRLPKSRKSKARPPVPEGFEARTRNNRRQLFRLHGRKLSAKGKPMWRRSYIGNFTKEGLKKFVE